MSKTIIPEGKYPVLRIIFERPQTGHWNGVIWEAEFTPNEEIHPGVGEDIKWGSYSANLWVWCKAGKDWAEALHIARKKLRVSGDIPHRVEIVWKDI